MVKPLTFTVLGRIPFRIVGTAVALAALALAAGRAFAAERVDGIISDVAISRSFFHPSLDQKIGISFKLVNGGALTVLILDRDGYVVRRLVSEKVVEKGAISLDWNGSDDSGEVVPDEAYSLKIDLRSRDRTESYFPAKAVVQELSVKEGYYDRKGGILGYKLPFPARVHLQAGTATIDPKTREVSGPVLKTIVNREPRPAGSVVENWNGYAEGGTLYVPDLPHFLIAIAITSLPENTILTSGNRSKTFLARAASRSGPSLLPSPSAEHAHHRGLTALEDVAPALKAKPLDAAWSASERVWRPAGKSVKVSVALEGASAAAFARQPAKLFVFVDRSKVVTMPTPRAGDTLSIPLDRLSPGTHVVAVNWTSSYGPVAVDAFRVVIGKPASLQPAVFK